MIPASHFNKPFPKISVEEDLYYLDLVIDLVVDRSDVVRSIRPDGGASDGTDEEFEATATGHCCGGTISCATSW